MKMVNDTFTILKSKLYDPISVLISTLTRYGNPEALKTCL